jgi:hypothetical protein
MVEADPLRMACLRAVQVLPVAGAWIGAGFVRSLVWDALCGTRTSLSDVDVLWFDPGADRGRDRALESMLSSVLGDVPWSVRNQARMHERNGDAPYEHVGHALEHWPETATAVALRLDEEGGLEVLAPFGLADLFDRIVRATPHMRGRADRRGAFAGRALSKGWEKRWPGVVVEFPSL